MKCLILLSLPFFLFAGYVHDHLGEKLATLGDNGTIRVLVYLAEQADCSGFPETAYEAKISHIKMIAQATQPPIVDWLRSQYAIQDLQQFSVVNAFACTLPKWLIFELAGRSDVCYVIDDYEENLLPPNETRYILDYFNEGEDNISWNQVIIGSPQVWNLGHKGHGITVGNMDTGVDWAHPRLRDSYRGISAWKNCCAYGSTTVPFDDEGHGTGTMGLLAANNGMGTTPNSKWVAVKILDSTGNAVTTDVVEGFDWVFNLPDSLRPKIMSNSWGWSSGSDTTFWTCCLNWKNAGILPVFSAGNSGPSGNTMGRPARLPTTLAVAATDPDDQILDYSSRGPAPNVVPINNNTYWYRSDWNYHKPDIAAPADPTTTTARDAQYQGFSGTSAASPHVAGVAALLLSKNPSLTSTNLYNIITDYAALVYPDHYNYPNDTFGWGRIDAFKAIQNIAEPSTPNLYITAARCTLDGLPADNDGELDPGEQNVRIKLRIKNMSPIAATGCSLRVWEENTYITEDVAKVSIGTINPGQEVADWALQIDATALQPEASYIFFKAKIFADGGYVKHDFFSIYVPYQAKSAFRDTLIKDNSTATYTQDLGAWFAAQFVAAGACTLVRVINMTYLGASTCSIGVWSDNNNLPGTRLHTESYTAGASLAWQDESLDVRVYSPPGKLWVGYWMSNNPTQCVMDGDGAAGLNVSSTDNGQTWPNSLSNDLMIRPVVKFNSINAPALAYGGSKIDDSEFGNDDGWLDPGERAKFSVNLTNYGVVCHNVTGKLRAADATTAERIVVLDSTANFNTVQNGQAGGNNVLDPFLIQMYDESPMEGWNPNFKMVVSGKYGTGNGSTYNDSFNFSITGPWMPDTGIQYFYPIGTADLWLVYNPCTSPGTSYYNLWWATRCQYGLRPADSVYVDSIAVFTLSYRYQCGLSSPTLTVSLRVCIWDDNNGEPGTLVYDSGTFDTGIYDGDYAWCRPNRKIPGTFWIGFYNVRTGTNSTNYRWAVPIFWGSPLIGDLTLVDQSGTTPWDYMYVSLPLAIYMEIAHWHPAISYYAPEGWTWPIVPSNSEAGDTVLDATLSAASPTYLTDFVCLNRSPVKAGPVSGGFDNYLFLDNWGLAYASPESLLGGEYSYAYTDQVDIPGGRHTLLSYLDWNDEVGANIFNYYLRTWGQQYAWTPVNHPATQNPWTSDYAPDYTGIGAGPYYNCNAWRVYSWNNRWQGVGIRPSRFATSADSIDIDLRLYSDSTTSPNAGLTQVLEASCLGPGKVDFVVWNGRKVGTTYFPGIYSFGSANDSCHMIFYPSRYYIQSPFTSTFTYSMALTAPIHVYDLIIPASTSYSPALTPATGLDLGIGLYNSIGTDHVLRRSDALIWADANGAGGVEDFTYTNSKLVADTFALVIWNNGGTGTYSFRGTGSTVDIAEEPSSPAIYAFALNTPYPNPAFKQLTISYSIPIQILVKIQLYDITGRLVTTLVDDEVKPGYYQVRLDSKDIAAGVYFCKMDAGEYNAVKKLILVR